ncbi:hypothetical protein HK096_001145 [Nowakowskiella sp. JEL0078]|nr:hypothetical protein HK096_001145 [Nowakowskiella sp. JEL0078]
MVKKNSIRKTRTKEKILSLNVGESEANSSSDRATLSEIGLCRDFHSNVKLKPGELLHSDSLYAIPPDEKPSTLWICLKCSEINCGRNDASHTVLHSELTNHEISMDVEATQIW